MAFTSWSALRTALKDAFADHVASGNWTGSYRIGDRQVVYRTMEEFKAAIQMTYEMEAIEGAGNPSTMVSYGRMRRFR